MTPDRPGPTRHLNIRDAAPPGAWSITRSREDVHRPTDLFENGASSRRERHAPCVGVKRVRLPRPRRTGDGDDRTTERARCQTAQVALSGNFGPRARDIPSKTGHCGRRVDILKSRFGRASSHIGSCALRGRGLTTSLRHRSALEPRRRADHGSCSPRRRSSSVASGRARNLNGTNVVPRPAETCITVPPRRYSPWR